jgi:16S rRNA (cytidine1402-2'-O)-methyltransferase
MATLFVVATPIGNLGDISARALEVLGMVGVILCEDTRETRKILNHYKIETPVSSLHEHSSDAVLAHVVEQLREGKNIAYVTDAGTPAISDPGGKLVELAYRAGVQVSPIPGPSSVMAALSVAGFPANEFQFLGYFPRKKGRQTLLNNMKDFSLTTVFFEAPYRIVKTLESIAASIPEREIFVGREMTKQFEEYMRGTAKEIFEAVQAKEPRGEYVIVVRGK